LITYVPQGYHHDKDTFLIVKGPHQDGLSIARPNLICLQSRGYYGQKSVMPRKPEEYLSEYGHHKFIGELALSMHVYNVLDLAISKTVSRRTTVVESISREEEMLTIH
jgi:hypothetical protein